MEPDMKPKVSVVIPTYKTAHLITAALESVLAQTFRDLETIVVNDGSPDTAELERVLAPFLGKIVYIKQENKRASGARNTAIQRALGDFLAFLDSDDVWLPEHIAAQLRLLEDPTLDLVYSDCFVSIDPRETDTFMQSCPSEGTADFEAIVTGRCQIPVSTVVARRGVFERAGLFDESLPICDDYDMWMRAAFRGAGIGYSRDVQARLNIRRPGSLSTSGVQMLEGAVRILENADRNLLLGEAERRFVRQQAAEFRAQSQLEQGKLQLQLGHFLEARDHFTKANAHFRRPRLTAIQLCMAVAPTMAGRVIRFLRRPRKVGRPRS
jgi:glycosyltransferase involved in cell wall biosynthesis